MNRIFNWFQYRFRIWCSNRYWSQYQSPGNNVYEQLEFAKTNLNEDEFSSQLWTL